MGLIEYSKATSLKKVYQRCQVVSEKTKRNAFFMFIDLCLCTLKYRSGVSDYFNYKFYERSGKERKEYVTIGDTDKFYEIVSPSKYKEVFTIKPNFLEKFKKYIDRDYWTYEMGKEALEEIISKHEYLMLKPIDGLGGKDVCKIKTKNIDVDALYHRAFRERLFLEAVVVQHPSLAKFSKTSCNTIRVMTLNIKGDTEIIMAVARIGNGVNDVDNFHQGGVAVKVDVDKGIFVGNAYNKNGEEFKVHEKSKIKFDGYKIPNWDIVKKMVLEAAKVSDDIKVVGFDVAITPSGATFIEGNRRPGWDLIQVVYDRGRKDLARYVLDKYNKAYDTNYKI